MSCISAPAQCRASMARKATVRQRQRHLVGVVGGDAGRADLLQQDRFEIGQMHHAAGEVDDRLAGADPVAFLVDQVDVDWVPRIGGGGLQPVEHQPGRADHRAAQEHRVSDAFVAEAGDDVLGAVEVAVGAGGDIGRQRRAGRPWRQPLVVVIAPRGPARRPAGGVSSVPRPPGMPVPGTVRRSAADRRTFRSAR